MSKRGRQTHIRVDKEFYRYIKDVSKKTHKSIPEVSKDMAFFLKRNSYDSDINWREWRWD